MRRLASVFSSKRREDEGKRSRKMGPHYSSLAHQHLLVLSNNAMLPHLSLPPFVQHNLGPLFPRSVNRPALLPSPTNTRVTMLRTHLVAQLANSDLDLDSSILPFGHNPPPPPLSPPPPSFPDISRPTNTSKIFPASPGIRRWIARPCFEDRHVVYFPSPSGVDIRPVSAAAMAIAALEFSEHLDAMADPDFDHHPESSLHASNPDPPPSVPSSRNSYTPSPSPLRNQHNPAPTSPLVTITKSHVKRVVRFAEDDSDGDDAIPLHILRMKKLREQKAKFLRQEQLRRTREEAEERRRREQEARRLEDEALQREHRRQILEKEKREREKALYAETIAATRLRRETHKAGGLLSSNTINLLLPSSPSFTSLRDSERNKPPESRRLSQLPHDPPSSLSIPRRQASDSALPINSYAHTHYPSDSSPSSSRPPSMSHSPSPVSPGGQGHHSRPPSTHSANTSSSEEIRHQGGSRPSSLTAAAVAAHSANGSAFGRSPMIASYPAWSGSNPNLQYIPPVPPFPDFVHDMPLLPPTAPFMKHSLRNGSPGPPSSSSSRRGSFTSSTERVNAIPASLSRNSSAQSLSPNLQRHESALSSSVKPTTHQRRGSGDSRNTTRSNRSRPVPTTSRSQPIVSRGRPQQPIRSQVPPPSTWMPLAPPQNSLMQPMPMMMVPAMMAPAYPMNVNVNMNANGMMRQSNLRSGASGGGGGSTSSKATGRGWRQTQAIIS